MEGHALNTLKESIEFLAIPIKYFLTRRRSSNIECTQTEISDVVCDVRNVFSRWFLRKEQILVQNETLLTLIATHVPITKTILLLWNRNASLSSGVQHLSLITLLAMRCVLDRTSWDLNRDLLTYSSFQEVVFGALFTLQCILVLNAIVYFLLQFQLQALSFE